jgi:asparagine synthase (glutamine-hydrolysing)
MAAFIHAEVNWTERPALVTANVQRMLDAVAHYPWGSSWVDDASSQEACCVLGLQCGLPGDNGGGLPDQKGAVRIVADIRLHARVDLLSKLGLSPDVASGMTDDALVIHSYRRWGMGFAGRLVGDGAFALWDSSEQRLICWRDVAGVRPLYYHHSPGRQLVVSSDLQSIAEHPETPSILDLPYVKAFLQSEPFQHPTRTMIAGVRKVPAAHVLVFDRHGLRLERYWDPENVAERAIGDDECGEELRELLRQSIRDRLPRGGEGVGAHLSGGLDSSSVAIMAASLLEEQGRKLSAFSWAPPWDIMPRLDRDERDLVELACQAGGLLPLYTSLEPSDVVAVAYRDVALRPRSTLDFEVATSRIAMEHGVRTILSGWGGDEVVAFNGRGYFADMARRGRLATVHRELATRSRIHGGSLRGAWKSRVVMPLLPDAAYRRSPVESPLPAELRPEFADLLNSVESLEHTYPRERPGIRRMQTALLRFGHLQFRMESWAAHGAAVGLNYTFPLLDRRILEFALSLPGRMFFRDGWKRWHYRTAMAGILPDGVRWNPDKYDSAAARQLREIRREPADVYSEPLLDRRDNPLVDVSVLLDIHDHSRQQGESLNGSSPVLPKRVGGGVWLAFTRLKPA